MSNYLTISSHGVICHRWNSAKRGYFDIHENKNGFSVVDNSGEIVYTAPTMEKAEQFFYERSPVENMWPHLRETVELEDGITVGDIINIIENDDMLLLYARKTYPNFRSLVVPPTIRRCIVISETLTTTVETKPFRSDSGPNKDTVLTLDERVKIYRNGLLIKTYKMSWSLIDFLEAMFGEANSGNITLAPHGLFDKSYTPIKDIFRYLHHPCELSPNLTLHDIFEFVKSEKVLEMFISEYSWCDVKAFHEAAEILPDKIKEHEIQALEVYSYSEVWDNNLNLIFDFHGKSVENENYYGVDFVPTNMLASSPITIKSATTLEIKGKDPHCIKCFRTPSLLEVLDAIYWEISFYGNPVEAQECKESLMRRKKELETELNRDSTYK
jgi:hypothetical protein